MTARIEDQSIDALWRMYERATVPPDVAADDFTRQRMRESFVSAAFTLVAIFQRLDELPDGAARRGPYLTQLREECERLALECSVTAGPGN